VLYQKAHPQSTGRGRGKSLLLIPVMLLRYLKVGFEKKKRKQLLLIQAL